MTSAKKSPKDEKISEPVEEKTAPSVTPETPVQEEPVKEDSAAPSPVQVMSQKDTEISDLVAEAPKSIDGIKIKDDAQHINLLELPEECKPLYKTKYRFRWIAKDKDTAARIRSSVWELCTRSNAPFIKPHRFKSHGAVEQAGMLLAFCTEEVGMRRELEPAIRSANLVKHFTKDLPEDEARGFYKPEDTGDENEEGLEEGVDF